MVRIHLSPQYDRKDGMVMKTKSQEEIMTDEEVDKEMEEAMERLRKLNFKCGGVRRKNRPQSDTSTPRNEQE